MRKSPHTLTGSYDKISFSSALRPLMAYSSGLAPHRALLTLRRFAQKSFSPLLVGARPSSTMPVV
jgi:hypothetical protein